MKTSILFIISFLVISCAKAQLITNYVKNPDFERYDTCPVDINDQIKYANYWNAIDSNALLTGFSKGGCVPEYCNSCIAKTPTSKFSVPSGSRYYQKPHSGNGMSLGYYFCDETPPPPAPYYTYRDYLQGRLYKNLTNSKSYCVTFYINLAEGTTYATNKMGAYLDDGSIDTVSICSKPLTFVKPQVYTNKVVDDTLNWVKIEGTFTANGTERFITLGNFFPKDSIIYTIPFITAHQWAYYLIDDVSVIESDLPADAGEDTWVEMGKQIKIGRVGDTTAIGLDCKWYYKGVLIDSGAIITINANAIKNAVDTYVVVQTICGLVKTDTVTVKTAGLGVAEYGFGTSFNVYPNPSNGTVSISYSISPQGAINTKVYDLLGRVMHQEQLSFNGKETSINLNIPSGSYILELKDEAGNVHRERIVKQ